jgi:2-keto-4-pentenoate hydratase/2-oxohepta-3-ene-1,7-dioic acid hydratase in catechol pathway
MSKTIKLCRILCGNAEIFAEYRNEKYYKIEGDIFGEFRTGGEIAADMLLPPVLPSKIVAFGANYADHAKELNLAVHKDPIIFLKPPSALIGSGGAIVYPDSASHVDFEGELAVVVGKTCKNLSCEEAKAAVFGYTCANDVSERVFQKADGQWLRAKGFDTFCPLGPYIVRGIDPSSLKITTSVNGEIKQTGNTRDMITDVFRALSFVSGVMTLYRGDVILTGTPAGIGEIKRGDLVEVEIEGIGILRNSVI